MRRWLAFLFLSLFSFAVAAQDAPEPQPASDKDKLVIAVGGKNQFIYLPLTIADRRGFFRLEGLMNVEIVDTGGQSKALTALNTGAAQIVSGMYEQIFTTQPRGLNLRAFVLQSRTPQLVFAVSNKFQPNFHAYTDLKGKRIGVTVPGSQSALMLTHLLAQHGLTPRDVFMIGIGNGNTALMAVRNGLVDALVNTDPVITTLTTSGEATAYLETRTVAGTTAFYGGLMPSSVLYTSDQYLQTNPNTVQAIANGMVRALKWMQTASVSDVASIAPEIFPAKDRAMAIESFMQLKEAYSPDGRFDADANLLALRFLQSYDASLKDKQIVIEKTYTNDLVERANEKY